MYYKFGCRRMRRFQQLSTKRVKMFSILMSKLRINFRQTFGVLHDYYFRILNGQCRKLDFCGSKNLQFFGFFVEQKKLFWP